MAANNARGAKQVIESVVGFFTDRSTQRVLPAALHYQPPVDLLTLATGFRPLDNALGIGGLPYGRITELIGPGAAPLSGAMSIAARIAAKVQRKQQLVTIIDMSHHFDPWLAERCGLVAPQLLLTRPETVFEMLTTLESTARQAGLVIVVMDLVAELLSHADPEALSAFLYRLRTIVRQSSSVFLFITSPQNNDPFSSANYPVGFPLAELADIRLWIQDEAWTYGDGMAKTYKASLTVIKNRLAIAGTGADLRIKFAA